MEFFLSKIAKDKTVSEYMFPRLWVQNTPQILKTCSIDAFKEAQGAQLELTKQKKRKEEY